MKEEYIERLRSLDGKYLNIKLDEFDKEEIIEKYDLTYPKSGSDIDWYIVEKLLVDAGFTIEHVGTHFYKYCVIAK